MRGRNCRQWIAGITMVVDHVGIVCDSLGARLWGRMSAPLYGLELRGSVRNILIIGVLAQIPYWIVVGHRLNFALTLAGVELLRKFLQVDLEREAWWGVVVLVVAGFVVVPVDGLGMAAGTALSRCTLKKDEHTQIIYWLGAAVAAATAGHWLNMAGVGVAYGLQKIELPEVVRVPKWIWRSLYPLHLGILAAAKWAIG
jgi:hypothetical protein